MLVLCGFIIALTRYVSLGVLMMFALAIIWLLVLISQRVVPFEYLFYSLAITSLILIRFRENIQRILAGTERRIGENS
jgi:glycerol-3-phosphate acyltransferase PlsY